MSSRPITTTTSSSSSSFLLSFCHFVETTVQTVYFTEVRLADLILILLLFPSSYVDLLPHPRQPTKRNPITSPLARPSNSRPHPVRIDTSYQPISTSPRPSTRTTGQQDGKEEKKNMSIDLPSEPIQQGETGADEGRGKMFLDDVHYGSTHGHDHRLGPVPQTSSDSDSSSPDPDPDPETSLEDGQWPAFLPSEGETMTTGTTEDTDLGLPVVHPGFARAGTGVGKVGGLKTPPGDLGAEAAGREDVEDEGVKRFGELIRGGGAEVVIVGEDDDEEIIPGLEHDDTGAWGLQSALSRFCQRTTTSTTSNLYDAPPQPPLTQHNLSRLPGHSPPTNSTTTMTQTGGQPMLKRFGLERTASWASASGSVGTSTGRERTCSCCPSSSPTADSKSNPRAMIRPGYKRSRTALPGVPSLMKMHGLGFRPSEGGLMRSRSFSVNLPVPTNITTTTTASAGAIVLSGTGQAGSGKQEVGSFHPYRLVTPSTGTGKKPRPRELDVSSPLFAKDMDLERSGGAASSSASSFHHHRQHHTGRFLRPSGLTRSHSDLRFETSVSAVHRRRAGLLRPRLWSHHSHPSRLRPAGSSSASASSSVSLRGGEVDEYMMDMDKWILGAGIDTASSVRSSVPEIVRTAPVEAQEDVPVVNTAGDLEGEDGKLWVDGRRVVCEDGTECLTTSEAYILTVQLVHQ